MRGEKEDVSTFVPESQQQKIGRAELLAVYEALRFVTMHRNRAILLSEYVVRGCNEWVYMWRRAGWRTAMGGSEWEK